MSDASARGLHDLAMALNRLEAEAKKALGVRWMLETVHYRESLLRQYESIGSTIRIAFANAESQP